MSHRQSWFTALVLAVALVACVSAMTSAPDARGGPTTEVRVATPQTGPQPERTTMLKHIAYITMPSSDQDKSLDFYTNVLGFEKRIDAPAPGGRRFLTVGVKGQNFDLVLTPESPGPIQVTLEVEDCRKAFEELTSRGVKFDPPNVIELPFAWLARFRDPDGNQLQVSQRRQAAAQR
jgi:catechol 2,3-dioxygenase-like lactoylglutathione lyase family enzyme